MPAGTAYCNLEDVREYIGADGSTSDNALIQRLIPAAQQAINIFCRRTFAPTATTRYYRPNDTWGQRLYLDADVFKLDSVTNGITQVIPASGYWLHPRNEWPPQMIELKSSYVWTFNTDGEIAIAGTFGWLEQGTGSILPDIRQACVELTTYLYRLKDSSTYDVVATPEMGQMTIPKGWPQHVNVDLTRYRRTEYR